MSNNVLVSVIISLYNYKHLDNLRAVIKSIMRQTATYELIISEQSSQENSIYKEIADEYGLKYVHTYPEIKENREIYNLGRVRNAGASVAIGEYLYFTDADILFIEDKYLEELVSVSKSEGVNLYRPSMLRLLEKSKEGFLNDYLNDADIVIDKDKTFCFSEYDQGIHKIITSTENEIIDDINGKPHVCMETDYYRVKNNKEFHSDRIEEFIWIPTFHYGGTLVYKSDFWRIGGYCERYYNWGLEDEDIHWKIVSFTKTKLIYDIFPTLKVMHFEHKKNSNNITYEMNRNIYEERLACGIDSAIGMDLENIIKYSI